jgi:hypothetical protein
MSASELCAILGNEQEKEELTLNALLLPFYYLKLLDSKAEEKKKIIAVLEEKNIDFNLKDNQTLDESYVALLLANMLSAVDRLDDDTKASISQKIRDKTTELKKTFSDKEIEVMAKCWFGMNVTQQTNGEYVASFNTPAKKKGGTIRGGFNFKSLAAAISAAFFMMGNTPTNSQQMNNSTAANEIGQFFYKNGNSYCNANFAPKADPRFYAPNNNTHAFGNNSTNSSHTFGAFGNNSTNSSHTFGNGTAFNSTGAFGNNGTEFNNNGAFDNNSTSSGYAFGKGSAFNGTGAFDNNRTASNGTGAFGNNSSSFHSHESGASGFSFSNNTTSDSGATPSGDTPGATSSGNTPGGPSSGANPGASSSGNTSGAPPSGDKPGATPSGHNPGAKPGANPGGPNPGGPKPGATPSGKSSGPTFSEPEITNPDNLLMETVVTSALLLGTAISVGRNSSGIKFSAPISVNPARLLAIVKAFGKEAKIFFKKAYNMLLETKAYRRKSFKPLPCETAMTSQADFEKYYGPLKPIIKGGGSKSVRRRRRSSLRKKKPGKIKKIRKTKKDPKNKKDPKQTNKTRKNKKDPKK